MVVNDQVSERVPAPAGMLRRAGRALWRHRLLTAAAAVIVAAGSMTAALVLPGGYGETISGPFGAYPAPLAATDQPHIVGHFYGVVRLDGGLAIIGDGNNVHAPHGSGTTAVTDGIAAVSLRTGRLYWSYRRPGHEVVSVAAAPSGLYVLWDDGLLVRMNPRTATIPWHHAVGANAAGQVWAAQGPSSRSTVLVISSGQIDAMNESTGSPLWSSQISGRCQFDDPAPTADVIVVGVHAADDGPSCTHSLRGYDLSTGQLRWQEPYPGWLEPPLPVGPDAVVGGTSDLQSYEVIAAASGRRLRTINALPDPGLVDGDGLLFAGYLTESGVGASAGTFGAWDTATGRLLWQHTVPGGANLNAGPFLLGSGQAYVVTDSTGPQIPDGLGDGKTFPSTQLWLYGYDARTGRLLSRTALPVLNTAGGNAFGYAHEMQPDATAVPVASSGDLLAISETSAYWDGVIDAGGSSFASGVLPTVVLSE